MRDHGTDGRPQVFEEGPRTIKTGPPIKRKAPLKGEIAIRAARKTKDDRKLAAAFELALKEQPERPDLRLEQARVLDRLGRSRQAREAYAKVLWPTGQMHSNLENDMNVIEHYLDLCERSGDREGGKKAFDRAQALLAQDKSDLPPKKLTTVSEVRSAIAYRAYRVSSNYERHDESRALLKKAIALDPTVAIYYYHYASEMREAGLKAVYPSKPKGIALWREGLDYAKRGLKVRYCSAFDKGQLDGISYDLRNYVDMANSGRWFNGPPPKERYVISR